MSRYLAAAAVVAATLGAAGPAAAHGPVLASPEVQAAIAACEQDFADHRLTSLAQVAMCERTRALPAQEWRDPDYAPMYQGLWKDKIQLYEKVDRGRLSKAEADRRIAIEADNWYSNLQSLRRF